MAGKSLADLIVKLGMDTTQFVTGMQKAAKAGEKLDKATIENNKRLKLMKKQIVLATAAMASLIAVTAKFTSSLIDAAVEMETVQLKFRFLLGSQKESVKMFKEIKTFAKTVAFEYRDLANAAGMLAAVMKGGVPEIMKWMPIITDIATVFNIPIQETTSQIIRMYASGAAAADMFRERAVTAMLGFQMGSRTSVEETRKTIIAEWEKTGSKFRGASAAMADTWTGIMSMLKDEWMFFRMEIMELGAFENFKDLMKELLKTVRELTEEGGLDTLARSISDILSEWTKGLMWIVKGFKFIHDFFVWLGAGPQTEFGAHIQKIMDAEDRIIAIDQKLEKLYKNQEGRTNRIKRGIELHTYEKKKYADTALEIKLLEKEQLGLQEQIKNVSWSINLLNRENKKIIEETNAALEKSRAGMFGFDESALSDTQSKYKEVFAELFVLRIAREKELNEDLKKIREKQHDEEYNAFVEVIRKKWANYDKFLKAIQSETSSIFYDMFNGTLNTWEDFTDRMKAIFLQMLANIAAEKFISSIVAEVIPAGFTSAFSSALGGATAADAIAGAGGASATGASAGASAGGAAATAIPWLAAAAVVVGAFAKKKKDKRQLLSVSGVAGFDATTGFTGYNAPPQVKKIIEQLGEQTVDMLYSLPSQIYLSAASALESTTLQLGFSQVSKKGMGHLVGKFSEAISKRWERSIRDVMRASFSVALKKMKGLEGDATKGLIFGAIKDNDIQRANDIFNATSNFLKELQYTIDAETMDELSLSVKQLNDGYGEQVVRARQLGVSVDMVNKSYRAALSGLFLPTGDVTASDFTAWLGGLPELIGGQEGISGQLTTLEGKLTKLKQKRNQVRSEINRLETELEEYTAGTGSTGGVLSGIGYAYYGELIAEQYDILKNTYENVTGIELTLESISNIMAIANGQIGEWNEELTGEGGLYAQLQEFSGSIYDALKIFKTDAGDLYLEQSVIDLRNTLEILGTAMEVLKETEYSDILPEVTAYRDFLVEDFLSPLQDVIDKYSLSDKDYSLKQLADWYDTQMTAIDSLAGVLSEGEFASALSMLDEAFALQSQSIIDNYIDPIQSAFEQFLTGILDLVPVQSAEMYGATFQHLAGKAAAGEEGAFQNLLNFTSGQFLPFFQGYASSDLSYGYQDVFSGAMQQIQQLTLNIDGQEFAKVLVDLAATNPELALIFGGTE